MGAGGEKTRGEWRASEGDGGAGGERGKGEKAGKSCEERGYAVLKGKCGG